MDKGWRLNYRRSIIQFVVGTFVLILLIIIYLTTLANIELYWPIERANVRMISEYVVIDIIENQTSTDEHALVTAKFHIENLERFNKQRVLIRFPMNHNQEPFNIETGDPEEYCVINSLFPPVDKINVKFNGNPINVEKRYCWFYFFMVFPPASDVLIEVAYTVVGFDPYLSRQFDPDWGNYLNANDYVKFAYVIGTGASWKDTIETADIIFRLPYDANNLNVLGCDPDDCIISGKEISFHYEDFEPLGILIVKIIKPSEWRRYLNVQEKKIRIPTQTPMPEDADKIKMNELPNQSTASVNEKDSNIISNNEEEPILYIFLGSIAFLIIIIVYKWRKG